MLAENRPPTHPGEMLLEKFLLPLELSSDALAARIGVKVADLEAILQGAAPTPNMALRLGRVFNTTPLFWLNLQLHWDLWYALHAGAGDLENIQPIILID